MMFQTRHTNLIANVPTGWNNLLLSPDARALSRTDATLNSCHVCGTALPVFLVLYSSSFVPFAKTSCCFKTGQSVCQVVTVCHDSQMMELGSPVLLQYRSYRACMSVRMYVTCAECQIEFGLQPGQLRMQTAKSCRHVLTS